MDAKFQNGLPPRHPDGDLFLCGWVSQERPVLATPTVAPGRTGGPLPGLGFPESPCDTQRDHPVVPVDIRLHAFRLAALGARCGLCGHLVLVLQHFILASIFGRP